jgi:hypothetical protein
MKYVSKGYTLPIISGFFSRTKKRRHFVETIPANAYNYKKLLEHPKKRQHIKVQIILS